MILGSSDEEFAFIELFRFTDPQDNATAQVMGIRKVQDIPERYSRLGSFEFLLKDWEAAQPEPRIIELV